MAKLYKGKKLLDDQFADPADYTKKGRCKGCGLGPKYVTHGHIGHDQECLVEFNQDMRREAAEAVAEMHNRMPQWLRDAFDGKHQIVCLNPEALDG